MSSSVLLFLKVISLSILNTYVVGNFQNLSLHSRCSFQHYDFISSHTQIEFVNIQLLSDLGMCRRKHIPNKNICNNWNHWHWLFISSIFSSNLWLNFILLRKLVYIKCFQYKPAESSERHYMS